VYIMADTRKRRKKRIYIIYKNRMHNESRISDYIKWGQKKRDIDYRRNKSTT